MTSTCTQQGSYYGATATLASFDPANGDAVTATACGPFTIACNPGADRSMAICNEQPGCNTKYDQPTAGSHEYVLAQQGKAVLTCDLPATVGTGTNATVVGTPSVEDLLSVHTVVT